MPLLTLSLPAACLSSDPALAARLAGAITGLTADILHKKRELTAVMVQQVADGQWLIGGTPENTTFALTIKITASTNTKDEKAAYIAAVFALMDEALGGVHPASYVIIEDTSAEAWGFGGLTQEARYILGKRA